MKRGRILNRQLSDALSSMGHGDWLVITDAGFPIPNDGRRIDLALEADLPSVQQVLSAILSDFIYEKFVVTTEQKENNPRLYADIRAMVDRCPIEDIPHSQFLVEYPPKAKFFVRTGAFDPWGNIALCSGVDAPRWFTDGKGIVVPDYYKDRVNYTGKY
jgi:D-ribose pyranose/furanose isomerase RbsD